ncbi:response regulator transcription factor [Pontixanthobacter sp.]|uniref:response regulator transcription factor n=1 Tax=Pontixanthobacter sp. TaxID=2792078 RepID=UPI003C79CDCE
MENAFAIHFVDPDSRSRAELSRTAFDLGYHAEVYADFDELAMRPLSGGIVVARDVDATGGVARLMREMAEASIWLPLIALADNPRPERVVMAMRAGALDYLSAPLTLAVLDEALSRLEDEAVEYSKARRRLVEARDRIDHLSVREREVLDWLTHGLSNKAIARELDISPRTVEIHRANMMTKLGAKHSAEAVRLRLEARI